MRDIPGYEGLYAATSCGKIWSYRTKKFLSLADNGRGYKMVCLYGADGRRKTYRVNRLIALAYIPNPDNLSDVAHLDNCRDHNWVSNLEWQSRKQNLDTSEFRENTKTKVFSRVRCVETGEIFKSCVQAAAAVGLTRHSINYCLLGYQKTAGGYHWERYYEKEENEETENNCNN